MKKHFHSAQKDAISEPKRYHTSPQKWFNCYLGTGSKFAHCNVANGVGVVFRMETCFSKKLWVSLWMRYCD